MAIFDIHAHSGGLKLHYYIEADEMEFNQVGNGAQFKINGEVIFISPIYDLIRKLTEDQFLEFLKKYDFDKQFAIEHFNKEFINWIKGY